jgi:hypothetical protein
VSKSLAVEAPNGDPRRFKWLRMKILMVDNDTLDDGSLTISFQGKVNFDYFHWHILFFCETSDSVG